MAIAERTSTQAIADTRAWVERMVLGEGLCPYARAPWHAALVRLIESDATTEQALVHDLASEIQRMQEQGVGTTLLIHPKALNDFPDYIAFLDIADEVLRRLGAEGELQIASFHPDYCFDGTPAEDAANYTNRSPWPMLHLLREADVAAAVARSADVGNVPERNIRHLRELGLAAISEKLAEAKRDP
ncbi:MAG: DUF1415 domain-containing protein [Pseudomonadota bacterium]